MHIDRPGAGRSEAIGAAHASMLLRFPPDVMPILSKCFTVNECGNLACLSAALEREASDPELWRSLALKNLWPPRPELFMILVLRSGPF